MIEFAKTDESDVEGTLTARRAPMPVVDIQAARLRSKFMALTSQTDPDDDNDKRLLYQSLSTDLSAHYMDMLSRISETVDATAITSLLNAVTLEPHKWRNTMTHFSQALLLWAERQYEHRVADTTAEDMPVALTRIAERIESSRSILELEDDWDGEGAVAYDPATWERATAFLRASASEFFRQYGEGVPAPKIWGGPNGSVDLHWVTDTRELLINVPHDPHDLADYYGDYGAQGVKIKGFLDPNEPNVWIMAWLTGK